MNGIRRQQYLEEIGITVWLERKLVDKETTNFNVKTISEKVQTHTPNNSGFRPTTQVKLCKFAYLKKVATFIAFFLARGVARARG